MSCNCNTASRTCDPCMFCTPPGVTGLTTCEPVDPCEKLIDSCCVFYSGESNPCLPVTKGEPLCDIIRKLVIEYFDTDCTTTTTTTTSTTSTTTSSTTTTTTAAPCDCRTTVVQNITEVVQYVTYTDCYGIVQVGIPVLSLGAITLCVCGSQITYNPAVLLVFQGASGCNTTTTTTSTTTTTTSSTTTTTSSTTTTTTQEPLPCTEFTPCYSYLIVNLSGGPVGGYYYTCGTGFYTPFNILNGQSITVCACENSVNIIPASFSGVSIINQGACVTTSTTTTTTTVAYDVISARVENILLNTCDAPASNYFVASGQTLTTGTTVYTDIGLTMPLAGFVYIVDGNSTPGKTIYNLDNVTGLIGTSTATSCP